MEDWGGLILCGGRSSRMGYDKARLRFPGGTLLERTLERMTRVAGRVVLSLAFDQETPALPTELADAGIGTVRDSEPEQGPLQGMLDGFRALAPHCAKVLVLPVDMPFFTETHMRRLMDGLEGHEACLYESEGFVNALTAAYTLELLPHLEALVASGRRRPIFLSEDRVRNVLHIGDEPDGGHPMQDVDTPEAYRAALLAEGVGVPGGADVSITVRVPDAPEEFVALHAGTAGDVLVALKRLAPPAWFAAPDRAFALYTGEDGPSPLAPDVPLQAGQQLVLTLTAD